MSLPISHLIGNPDLDAAEIRDGYYAECGMRPCGLPDSPELERRTVEREMAEAFGWNAEESPDEAEAHYQSWLRSQAATAAEAAGGGLNVGPLFWENPDGTTEPVDNPDAADDEA